MHIYCGLWVVQHKCVWSYSRDRFCLAYVLGLMHWLNCGFALIITNTMYNKVLYVIGTVTLCMISVISVEHVWEFQVKCVRTLIMQCCFDYLFQWIFCKKTNWKRLVLNCNSGVQYKCRLLQTEQIRGSKRKLLLCLLPLPPFYPWASQLVIENLQTSCEQF